MLKELSDCEVVISGEMGQKIYNDLINAGKEVYITNETITDKAVRLFLEGKLKDFGK